MPEAGTSSRMTAQELAGGIRRAHALFDAAASAAKEEYGEGRRKIAATRKAQTARAREQRDRQIRELREQFARERQP